VRISLPTSISVPQKSGNTLTLAMNTRPNLSIPTGSSGVSSGDSDNSFDELSKYIEEMYAKRLEAARAELERAYNRSVLELDATEEGLGPIYTSARNRTAANKRDGEAKFRRVGERERLERRRVGSE
jgi:hypothetical protein